MMFTRRMITKILVLSHNNIQLSRNQRHSNYFLRCFKKCMSTKSLRTNKPTWIIGAISAGVIGCGTSIIFIFENGMSQWFQDLYKAIWLQKGNKILSKILPVTKINESFNDFEEWRTFKDIPWSKEEDEGTSSWCKWLFPWDLSKSDSPWVLLDLTRSPNYWVRQMGVASLAGKKHWDDYKYRYVAQAMDPRTAVALARYPHSSSAFFLPPPALSPDQTSLVSAFKDQLSRLPEPRPGSMISFYRNLALDEELPSKKDPLTLDLDVIHDMYTPQDEAERRTQRELRQCLKALLIYSAENGYAKQFVHNNGLAVLQRLYTQCEDTQVLEYLASILTNLSQHPQLLQPIQRTGWLYILRVWAASPDCLLSLLALTSLANLDTDWYTHNIYQDMILLHPTCRNSKPAKADIVFVHGLNGGVVKTWRQMDSEDGAASQCWPKDWLASEFPNTRILSIGYATDVLRWGDYCPYEQDKRTLEGRGKELIKKLQQAGVGSRPIIWIGHSMGGLLIKQMLSLCESDPHWGQMTLGIVMYSVPHLGSPLADRLMMAKYLLLPSTDVQELVSYSTSLQLLHQRFMQYVNGSHVRLLSFGESKKTFFTSTLPEVMIVPPESSDLGVGRYISLPTNHINTCKPMDRSDPSYTEVVTFIRQLLGTIDHPPSDMNPDPKRKIEDHVGAFLRDKLGVVNKIASALIPKEVTEIKDNTEIRYNEAFNNSAGIRNNAEVRESAEVRDSAEVRHSAEITDNTKVTDNTEVEDS